MSTSIAPSAATTRPVRPPRPARPPRVRVSAPPRPALQRPRECAVSGVSAGIARHLGAPLWAVRALFVVLALFGGAGVLLYMWCWAFMPWEPGDAATTRSVPVAWVLVAGGVGWMALRVFLLFLPNGWEWIGGVAVLFAYQALAVALLTAGGLWAGLIDRRDLHRGPQYAAWVRAAVIALLVVQFAVSLAIRGQGISELNPALLVLSALLPLVGIAVVLSSTLIERFRELSGERVARIREEQRAEMAAHLHDSVLQTLALIQNRAGASSEVARLARAQERELRAWLYDGDQPADSDLPTDLRDYAGALELDYPVRIDVVSAGLSTERASGEIAAAAREAMLNAARHAGGEVSVYIEGSAAGVDVFIRDRGAGFVMDAVPADRLGIRQSIVGRMRRAGGVATVRSTDAGTEVHLSFGAGDDRG